MKVLRRLGADPALLPPVVAVADAGAPTIESLRADLTTLGDRVVAEGVPAPTGSYLDRLMGGLQSSDLVVLAGRPGMGKTALATGRAGRCKGDRLERHRGHGGG